MTKIMVDFLTQTKIAEIVERTMVKGDDGYWTYSNNYSDRIVANEVSQKCGRVVSPANVSHVRRALGKIFIDKRKLYEDRKKQEKDKEFIGQKVVLDRMATEYQIFENIKNIIKVLNDNGIKIDFVKGGNEFE